MPHIIAYDLGTGGVKATLHRDDGVPVARTFIEYATDYPRDGWHEQRPEDWWRVVCEATGALLADGGIAAGDVRAVGLSGQSRVAAPLDRDGSLLLESVPIWSDTRAAAEADALVQGPSFERWYLATGCGDPPATYAGPKLMWLRRHRPDVWRRTSHVVGAKDYINLRLTGTIATDPSEASATGLYSLAERRYAAELVAAAGIDPAILPPIVEPRAVVGTVTASAASATGLAAGTLVACGGIDNSCMALGATGISEGRAYLSLGSSSWIALTSDAPILDASALPFVFPHPEAGLFTSAVSIFAAGSAWRWARDELCRDLPADGAYERMEKLATAVPPGAHGVMFNPTLAGASPQNASAELRGAFAGITLSTTRADLLRAVLEGVAMDLRCSCLDILRDHAALDDAMLLCGGGGRSPLWRQIIADVFGMDIRKSSVEQDAASLGAGAIAARAAGLWGDYRPIDALHTIEAVHRPDPERRLHYERALESYRTWTHGLARIGARTAC
jgi:xylulokinase